MRPTRTRLLDPREALTGYLDSLFRDAPALVAEAAETAVTNTVETPTAALPQSSIATPLTAPADPGRCAVIRVGRLRLALPLTELYGIRRLADRLTCLPGQPAWVLGVSGSAGERVLVVDAAMMLARGSVLQEYSDLHLVTIAAGRWALACNGVETTVSIAAEAVRWRERREEDPWFSGVVAGELCTLIDVPALVAWLDARAAPLSSAAP